MNRKQSETTVSVPILPIRDRVVFPKLSVPLVVGRPRSVQAVNHALTKSRQIFVVAQRNMKVEDPTRKDLFEFGTLAEIMSSNGLADGFIRIRVIGRQRAKLLDLSVQQGSLVGDVLPIDETSPQSGKPFEWEAMRRIVLRRFEDYAKRAGRIPAEIISHVRTLTSLGELVDHLADSLFIDLEEKQDLLELVDIEKRINRLIEILDSEIEILQLERKIQSRVHRQIEKNQREYYLNEQMRAIQKELKKKDDLGQEVDDFRGKVKNLKMPQDVEATALKEISRLEKMMPYSPEATVVRTYLEWLLALPWSVTTQDHINVEEAKRILEEDHFGLEKPKERILEYLAVLKLTKIIKGPILCFIGPPGTGKTSLVKSMARALGRKFIRISLGGVRDEAEIRGHRRTYIGSMPGRLIQALRRGGTKNPVILLDEIDKMGSDWRGDPSSALLEVLDPEQNKAFIDHFIDVGFDLSQIIFIATGNSLYDIPRTLLDRLEILRFSAYTTDEKVSIAQQFILHKEAKEHGLPKNVLKIEDETLRKIIHTYTQEAGVREMQRKIAKICRKVAVEWVKQKKSKKKPKSNTIRLKDLSTYLGPPEYIREKESPNAIGVATGLAWTEHGGETLTIEVTNMPGNGKVLLTGKLGSVMQESAQTAFSLVKSKAGRFNIQKTPFQKSDLHVHVPEGAVPKDGPSAGIALATAIVSTLTGLPVRKDLAMTGEITLRGRVLGVGGLKEKVLAAFHNGIKEILYPKANMKDLPDIPETVRKNLKLKSVETVDEVFKLALQPTPPRSSTNNRKAASLPRHN
ncbi:endopeptidase La [bacterium F11]|nr:endopeptidase La [bacterium F11]